MQAAIRTALKSAYVPFTAAHRYFYDVLGSPDSTDDSPLLAPYPAPDGWERHEWGPWVAYRPPVELPDSGWKLHVSALPATATRVIAQVLEHCWALGVPVKTLRSEHSVLVCGAKYAEATASGKVVTAYPSDPDVAARLLDRLVIALADEPGPRILGELRVAGTPVHLRHGAFVEGWHEGTDGRLRPGRRDGSQMTADTRGAALLAAPQVLPPQLRRFVAAEAPPVLDVDEVAVLHRSNGGAVYRARWKGGPTVVLKEAERHSGLDAGGVDAATRLEHEHAVLTRLSGSGIVPEVLERLTVGSSEFIVMEHVEGVMLTTALAAHHPGSNTESSMTGAAYRDWVEETADRLRGHAHTLAALGVSHGDLHPGNVIEAAGRLVLIDLESASLDGRSVSLGVAAEGFSSGRTPDLADDLRAIGRVRLTLLSPHTAVLPWRPDLEVVLEESAVADIERRAGATKPHDSGAEPFDTRNVDTDSTATAPVEGLTAGIRACASPHRSDRLFPGDIAQFTTPGAGLGLLTGAAGVLLALDASGAEVDAAWLDWLIEQARITTTGSGLGHGLEGVALALALLGRPEAAGELAARVLDREVPEDLDPWWEFGHSGRALALTELAVLLDDADLARAADTHIAATLAAVLPSETGEHDTRGAGNPEAGLTAGWSGVALALIAVADLTPVADGTNATQPVDGIRGASRATCLQAALAAVLRETQSCVVLGAGLFTRQGQKALPYLGSGSAALGLAAQSLLDRRGRWLTLDDDTVLLLGRLVAGTRATCSVPVVAGACLLTGRSGLLATLRRLTGDGDGDDAVALHAERLGWYAVPLTWLAVPVPAPGKSTCEPRVLLGHTNLRLSTDLSTGSAGALVALAPQRVDALHRVLRLPASTPPGEPADALASTSS